MKLNDTIENKETAVEAVTEPQVKITPKKPSVKTEIAITEENLDKLIPQWKAKYGKIYKNELDDNDFVIWRPVKRREYRELLDSEDQVDLLDKQEAITRLAILYPADPNKVIESMAGLATVLSEEILKYSGFELSETQSL